MQCDVKEGLCDIAANSESKSIVISLFHEKQSKMS